MQSAMIEKAKELLDNGTVVRVVGWRKGGFGYDVTPSVFTTVEDLEAHFTYDDFCGPNLSKYLVKVSRMEGRSLVFLKPCDSFSFTQLLDEHRIVREQVYVVGIPCAGMVDHYAALDKAGDGVTGMRSDGTTVTCATLYGDVSFPKSEVLEERCRVCKSSRHPTYDELIGEEGEDHPDSHRFDEVRKIDAMDEEQRYAFWRGELSRCIRCNACRDVCPACTCELCVFTNEQSGATTKAPVNSFEENLYHIIRAFHVAGRCTDCGECSRVCPERIPLHLLNRKLILDYDRLYGTYQAGEKADGVNPLFRFAKDDPDPSEVMDKGEDDHA